MKKKYVTLLLTASTAICVLFGLTACKDSVSPHPNNPSAHTHTWGEWSTQVATCTESGEKVRKCETCGESETEILSAMGHKWEDWQTDETRHWQICSNGCGLTTEKIAHEYNGQGVCTECKTVLKGTQGLEYVLAEDGKGYAVRLGTALKAESLVIPYKANDGKHGELPVTTIEDSTVNGMHEGAFQSLFIPASVQNIGGFAFYNCTSLETVTVNGAIGMGMFGYCSALKKVNITENIETVPEQAFYQCKELEEVSLPNSIKNIGSKAFYYCSSLTSFDFAENAHIGEQAFYYSGLESVNLPKGSVLETNAFLGCYSMTSATIASTSIGNQAFSVGKQLTDLTLLEGIETIGDSAFSLIGVRSVVIPDTVTTIGKSAFNGCKNLMHVTIGKNVTVIGENAFSYKNTVMFGGTVIGESYKLVDVHNKSRIPVQALTCDDTNGNLGKYARNVYSDTLGKSALSVKEKGYIFYNDGETAYFMEDMQQSQCVEMPELAQNQTYSIYPYAFDGNTEVQTVVFANCINEIGDCAFVNCSNLAEADMKNTYITKIGKAAFRNCMNLKRVVLPASLEEIGTDSGSPSNNAFSGCQQLIEVINLSSNITVTIGSSQNGQVGYYALNVITEDNEKNRFIKTNEGFEFYDNGTGEYVLVAYTGTAENLTLTGKYQGKTYSIGSSAFYGNKALKSVVINAAIGKHAFENCTALTSVTFQSDVKRIEFRAFMGCTKLNNIVIPVTLTEIWREAFRDCRSLKNVSLENASGWQYCMSNYFLIDIKDFSSNDLTDKAIAAEYLVNDYSVYYWRRK